MLEQPVKIKSCSSIQLLLKKFVLLIAKVSLWYVNKKRKEENKHRNLIFKKSKKKKASFLKSFIIFSKCKFKKFPPFLKTLNFIIRKVKILNVLIFPGYIIRK